MKKKEATEAFVPIQIDKYATQVHPDLVRVEGVEELVPLEEYLARKEQQLLELRTNEERLYRQAREVIKQSLPVRGGQWQEECRQLSWAYQASNDHSQLRGMVEVCPSMALLSPHESTVTAHHLSHFIRAFLASLNEIPSVDYGNAPNIIYQADDEEGSLEARIACWDYLLRLVPTDRVVPTSRRQSTLELILEQQRQILETLKELKEQLCKPTQQTIEQAPQSKRKKSTTTT